jgi:hypothetical protein
MYKKQRYLIWDVDEKIWLTGFNPLIYKTALHLELFLILKGTKCWVGSNSITKKGKWNSV